MDTVLRRAGSLLVALSAVAAPSLNAQNRPEVQLRAAIETETVKGDLEAAIEQYKAIAQTSDRPTAAQALLRMAECYEKLGNVESRKVYQRVVREFADQKDVASLAKSHLERAIGDGRQQSGLVLRRVWDGQAGESLAAALYGANGQRVVYTPLGTGSVNVHDLASGSDRALTAADGCSGPSAISRDGTLVAYERYCGKYGSDLRLVTVRGSSVSSRLLYENADVSQITPLDISPDKASVVVTIVRKDQSNQIALVNVERGSLSVLKTVDWRRPSRIYYSPDGRALAYDLPASDTTAQRDVFILAVDGSRDIPVVAHPANDVVMGWSPDGRHLLFASDRRGGVMGLWAQALEARQPQGPPQLITESINSAFPLGVSGDALYLHKFAGDRDIAMIPIDVATGKQTGPAVRPIQSFIGTNLEPAWSPDGKSLAYVSWRSNNPVFGDPRVLAIRFVDTGETRELRPNLVYFDQMSWAPDGHAFVTAGTDLKGRNWVFLIDARTGAVATLAALPQEFERACPQWSPDGRAIYYRRPLNSDGSGREVAFIERTLASGDEREIARGDLGAISVSPDGQWIAAQRNEPSTRSQALVVIPVKGGAPRELIHVTEPQSLISYFAGIPWVPDSRGVLLRKITAAKAGELWLVPLEGAARKMDIDVTQWGTGNWGLLSLSPDGRQLAFLAGRQHSEVWVLENFMSMLKSERR